MGGKGGVGRSVWMGFGYVVYPTIEARGASNIEWAMLWIEVPRLHASGQHLLAELPGLPRPLVTNDPNCCTLRIDSAFSFFGLFWFRG